MQTLYSPNELAERWGVTPRSIRQMEIEGKLHRIPDMPGVKYSIAEIEWREVFGLDTEVTSHWEFQKVKEENAELKRRLDEFEKRNLMAQQVLRGGI